MGGRIDDVAFALCLANATEGYKTSTAFWYRATPEDNSVKRYWKRLAAVAVTVIERTEPEEPMPNDNDKLIKLLQDQIEYSIRTAVALAMRGHGIDSEVLLAKKSIASIVQTKARDMSESVIVESPIHGHNDVRGFNELRSTGMLWLINRTTFYPRGYGLGLVLNPHDEPYGWVLKRKSKPLSFSEEDDQRGFDASSRFLSQAPGN